MHHPQPTKNNAVGLEFIEQMCYVIVGGKPKRVLLHASSRIRYMRLAEQIGL